jgi:hypothetical protein
MSGPIRRFFTEDHDRLDALLRGAVSVPDAFDEAAYADFRKGILRHIAWEEKILLPAARRARGGEPLPLAPRLRVDHGAIALLLVGIPDAALVAELRSILEPHNRLEEEPGGLYDLCEDLLSAATNEILEKLRAYPDVRVAPYNDGPLVIRRAEDALNLSRKQSIAR